MAPVRTTAHLYSGAPVGVAAIEDPLPDGEWIPLIFITQLLSSAAAPAIDPAAQVLTTPVPCRRCGESSNRPRSQEGLNFVL